MVERLDRIAARHHGLAPIVVMPDQLEAASNNPMCLDGPLGNSATYLTQDVPKWVRANLHAATRASDWAIAGFSQGGTCALQLGATFPDRFGSWIDVSGQRGPTLGDEGDTIKRGFRATERRTRPRSRSGSWPTGRPTPRPPPSSRLGRTTAGTGRSCRSSRRPHGPPGSP